jgi:DNA mismatch repair protein MutL
VLDGYMSLLMRGRYPIAILFVTVPAGELDVNVHPAKLEVRFRDRIAVERVVEEAIRHALGGLDAAAPVGEWRPMPQQREAGLPASLFARLDGEDGGDGENGEDGSTARPPDRPSAGRFTAPVTQLFNTYIVFEGPDAMVMVDQHSAHERVLFEEVMAQLSGGGAASQRLLLPETLELTDEELDALERHRETIEAVGYQVEPFGGRSVVLHSVPAPHRRFDAIACFREMIADLARGRFGGWANRLERFAATYACRAAVKGGMPLGEDEMRALLFRLFESKLAPHDVHGRSTIVQLPREELERRFGRR